MPNIKYIVLFLFLAFPVTSHAAVTEDWGPFTVIYQQNDYKLEVAIKGDSNTCSGGKPFVYKYRSKGTFRGSETYIIWSVVIRDCDNKIKKKSISDRLSSLQQSGVFFDPLQYQFTCKAVVNLPEKKSSKVDNKVDRTLEIVKNIKSISPKLISGPTEIYSGQQIKLIVEGGELGADAEWVWYKNQEGTKIFSKGDNIIISEKDTGTYFVRAESQAQITSSAIKIVTTSKNSIPPNGILGKDVYCIGDLPRLKIEGGMLAVGAMWAWYAEKCGGELLKKSTEPFLDYRITANNEIFVRAEGNTHKTNCANLKYVIAGKITMPSSFNGKAEICFGEQLVLETNNKLEPGNTWQLTENACTDGLLIGTNNTGQFIITPSIGYHTYYLKSTSSCGISKCLPYSVNVTEESSMPNNISSPVTIIEKKSNEFSVYGGRLGNGSQWVWYYGINEIKKSKIGTGNKISFAVPKSGKLFVYAQGSKCDNNLKPIYKEINALGAHSWSRSTITESNAPKIFHIGFNFGIETAHYSDYGSTYVGNTKINSYGSAINMLGLGVKIGFDLSPIYTKYFSLNLNPSFAIGVPLKINSDSLQYISTNLPAEIAIGANRLKLLVKGKLSFDTYTMSAGNVGSASTPYTQLKDGSLYTKSVGIGLRLGRFHSNVIVSKSATAIDLYFQSSQITSNSLANNKNIGSINSNPNMRPRDGIFPGIGAAFWVQNKLKLNAEVNSNIASTNFIPSENILKNPNWKVSLVLQFDWFY